MDLHDPEKADIAVAGFLAGNTSKTAAIFRRYDELALHNILHLSRKLAHLERRGYVDQDLSETLKDYCECDEHRNRRYN